MIRTALRLAAGLMLLPLAAFSQTTAPTLTPGQQMDKIFDFWNRLDQPGFAVVVVKDGQVAYQNVFGVACQEHLSPITPNTVFNVSTLAKPFVGLAVALLEKDGKLSLDDDVRKYIPELPDFGTPVNVRHLLYQTSGLRDWLSVLQLSGRDREEVTIDTVLDLVKSQKKLIFTPGERFQNSNTDYDLLAEVVKRATGKSLSEWAWENIFKPLKMTRTQFRDNCRSIFDDEALSYNFTRSEYLRGVDNLSLVGSHSLFTSISDLAKWLINFETAKLGGPEIVAKMFAPGLLNNGQPAGFGYGLSLRVGPEGRQFVQTGSWAGSQATVAYVPDKKFGLAGLANWDYTQVAGFVEGIMGVYIPQPTPPAPKSPTTKAAKTVKVKPAILDSYAGDYRLGSVTVLTIGREGGQLTLSVPGAKFTLTTVSETEFAFDLAGAKIVFQKDKSGKVNQFLWNQGGEDVTASRVVLVKPTPKELEEYVGAYHNDEIGLSYAVELKGEAIVLNATGQTPLQLAPDEKDRFTSRSRIVPTVVFQRDGQGRIMSFIIDSELVRDLVFERH
jgi:CubicO group peptidase (beta-lactamase class C family)